MLRDMLPTMLRDMLPTLTLVAGALTVLVLLFVITPQRFIRWLAFGLCLSLLPLVLVAMSHWAHGKDFLEVLTTKELLVVGFTLSGAAGVDALTATGRFPSIRHGLGSFTILFTMFLVGFYWMVETKTHNFSDELIASLELISYVLAAFLSFFSELLAGP